MPLISLPSNPNPDSFSDFARNSSESVSPELWGGLVGAWAPFLGASRELVDVSKNNNPGILTAPTWKADYLDFDYAAPSINNNLIVCGNTLFTSVHDFTMIVEARPGPDTSADNYWILAQSQNASSTAPEFGVGFSGTNMRLRVYMAAATQVNSGSILLTRNEWQTVAMVYRVGTSIDIYVDGQLLYNDTSFTDYTANNGSGFFSIGGHRRTTPLHYPADVDIKYAVVYDRALPLSVIQQYDYNPKGLWMLKDVPVWFSAAGANLAAMYYRTLLQGDRL